ncbi:MAG TPA: hypothetical protein VG604_04695 [Candidatus Saccharimonadales bacterium]|nr:hypothetical protein [Candidatus Saccharimonadales bacterium]
MPIDQARFELETNAYSAELIAKQVTLTDEESVGWLREASARLSKGDTLADEVSRDVAAGAMLWIVRGSIDLPYYKTKTPLASYGLVQVSQTTPMIKRLTGNAPDCQLDRAEAIGSQSGIGEHAVVAGVFAALQNFDADSRFREGPALTPPDPNYHPYYCYGKVSGPISRGIRAVRKTLREGFKPYVTVDEHLSFLRTNYPWVDKDNSPLSGEPEGGAAEALTASQS